MMSEKDKHDQQLAIQQRDAEIVRLDEQVVRLEGALAKYREMEVAQRDTPVDQIARKLHDPEYTQLIKDTYAKGCTDNEFRLAMETARHLRLDPVAKQIYFIKRGNNVAVQVSIDGMRLVAERTGKYAGQLAPQWCGLDGKWVDVWLGNGPPAASRIGVLRHDFAQPLYTVARYQSYVQTSANGSPNTFWHRMPDVMIAKVAESLALRRAFPSELSGCYSPEEMGQATNGESTPAAPATNRNGPGDEYSGILLAMHGCQTMEQLEKLTASLQRLQLLPEQRDLARLTWQQARDRIKGKGNGVPRETQAPEPEPAPEPEIIDAPSQEYDFGPPPWDEQGGQP